jgi:peptide/nickel transport system substrate-binding protein
VNDHQQYSRRVFLGLVGGTAAAAATLAVPGAAQAVTNTKKKAPAKKPTATTKPKTTNPATTAPQAPAASANSPAAAPKGTLKIGGGWVFITWNAHDAIRTGTGPIIYWRPVYDTLFNLDSKYKVTPGLVTKSTFDEKGLSMTLRDGVVFSDGSPLNAEAVVANLKDMLKDPRALGLAASIKAITAEGTNQVRIETSAPVPNLQRDLASQRGMIIHPSLLGNPKINDGPIGSGPYVFDGGSSIPGQKLVYKINPKHWNPAAQTAEKIEISILPDQGARLNALLSGQIDVTYFDNALSNQATKAGFKSVATTGAQYGIMIFDRRGEVVPALASSEVRQALGWAVDRAAFANATLPGIGQPATQPYLPNQNGYEPTLDSYYGFDRDRAKQLLAKGGFPDGFSFDIPVTAPFQQPIEILAASWREIGVRARLVPLDISEYGPKGTSGQFPILFVPVFGRFVYDAAAAILDARGGLNPKRLSEPAASSSLNNLERAFDDEKDRYLGARVMKDLTETGAYICYAIGNKLALYKDGVAGVEWNVDEPGINPIGIKPKP